MTALTPALQDIVDDFAAVEPQDRLLLLDEIGGALPALPERYAVDTGALERVEECQSPVFVIVDVDDAGVHVHATAPAGAPTTRGFASILVQGLEGVSPAEALAVPGDLPSMLGLEGAVSLLRQRGMAGMLARIQRQIRARLAAQG